MEKKIKFLKKVGIFLSLGILTAGGAFYLTNREAIHNDGLIDTITNVINQDLSKPQNVAFDNETKTISWDKVEGATNYNVIVSHDGYILYETSVKDNSFKIDFNSLDERFFAGDEIKFTVQAQNEKEKSGKTYHKYVFESHFNEYHTEIVDNINKNLSVSYTRYKDVQKFNFLDFEDGKACGQMTSTYRNKTCFTFFNVEDQRLQKVTDFESFYENFNNFGKRGVESQFITGYKVENEDVLNFYKNNTEGLDLSEVKDMFLYKDYGDVDYRANFYSFCVQKNDNSYHFYRFTYPGFSGPDDFMLEMFEKNPEKFKVEKYFECQQSGQQNEFLQRLNQDLYTSINEQGMEY